MVANLDAISVLCVACGRIVRATAIRETDPGEATFFTLDDHEGPDGRCRAVGDVTSRPPRPLRGRR